MPKGLWRDKEKDKNNFFSDGCQRIILKKGWGKGKSTWCGILFKGHNGDGKSIFITISRGKNHRAMKEGLQYQE